MTTNPLALQGDDFDHVVTLPAMQDLGAASVAQVVEAAGGAKSSRGKFRDSLGRLWKSGELYSWMGGPPHLPTRYFSLTAQGAGS